LRHGELIKKIDVYKRAHNTICWPSGKNVYLDDIASPWLYIADAKKQELVNKVGPFANFIRPFTINGKETLVYVTVDSLLGFEVGDLVTGKKARSCGRERMEHGSCKKTWKSQSWHWAYTR
jgi:hypothetical protein